MKTRTAAGALTLPGDYYTSTAIFERELEAVFSNRWLYAGHVDQLRNPGDYLLFDIDVESLIVLRDGGDQTRAYFNVCRHRGARLCTEPSGSLGTAIQCPYHAWTYGLDGALVAAPMMNDVEGFAKSIYPLHRAAASVWEGLVFVCLADEPTPFEEAFAALQGRFRAWQIADLERVHRTTYDVAANWKLLFQNYSECYHCPTVHPALNRLTPFRDSHNDLEEGPVLGGPMRMSMKGGSMTTTGARCAAPLGDVGGEDLNLVYYYTLFPNLFLSLHPDYVLVHRAVPLAVDRTRVVCEWYFHPEAQDAPDFDPLPAIEFWDLTNRQDWHLCTLSQQGISSRAYSPGPYSDFESQLAAFDREYLRALGSKA